MPVLVAQLDKQMIRTAKQEPHTADFAIVVDNTVKFPVKLPRNDACRVFKAEGLIKQKGQQRISREFIFNTVNSNALGFCRVPCNRKIFIEMVPGQRQSVKNRFVFKKQQFPACIFLFNFKLHC